MSHRGALSLRHDDDGRWTASFGAIFVLSIVAGLQLLIGHSFNISLRMVPGAGLSMDLAYEAISEGSLTRRIGIVALGAIGFFLLYRSRNRFVRLTPVAGTAAALFVLWASLSLAWAVEPPLVARRLVSFWLLLLASVGVFRWAPPRSIPWFLGLSSFLYVMIGVGTELALGTFQPLGSDYRFSGTLHPNAQGINCALLVLSATWIGTEGGRRNRAVGFAIGAVGLLFLLLTRSRTSFAATMGSVLVLLVLKLHPRRRWIAVVAAVNLGILLIMLYVNGLLDVPLELLMLGRGDEDVGSLNSRLPLWQVLAPYIAERPVTGFGFSGFMNIQHAREIALIFEFGIAGSHSVYLETILGVGAVGLILFVLSMVAAFMRGVLSSSRVHGGDEYSLFAAVVAFELLSGVLESSLVFPAWRFPSLLVLTALCLTEPRYRERR